MSSSYCTTKSTKRKLDAGENPQPTVSVKKTLSRKPLGRVTSNKTRSTTNNNKKSSLSDDTMAAATQKQSAPQVVSGGDLQTQAEGEHDMSLAAARGPKRTNVQQQGAALTNDKTLTATKSQQADVAPIPAPGGLCRIRFDKANDFFGEKRSEAAGWYPATILKVTRLSKNNQKSFQVASRYDDLSKDTFVYPNEDVELIHWGSNDDDKHLMYTEKGEVFYNKRPKKLQAGDLVFAYYQNGRENKCWFRGRVAWVGRNDAREPVCDIAYDDGEYECNIPYTKGTVLLVQDGREHPAWLHGLKVDMSSKKKRNVKSGIIVGVEENGSVYIEYQDGKGGSFLETRSYKAVVTSLFNTRKSERAMPISNWPNISYEWLEPDTSPLPVGMELPMEDEETGPKRKKARTTKEMPKKEAKPQPKKSKALTSKEPKVKNQTTTKKGPTKKSGSQKAAFVNVRSTHEDNVEAIEESDYYSDNDAVETEDPRAAKEMLPSLATILEKTLNSSDTQLGYDLLTFMRQHQGQVPNNQTCRELIDLITFGPRSGEVLFPDVHRLDLAQRYTCLLLSNAEMKDKLSNAAGDSYWETCLGQLSEKYYTADGDETRKTGAAISRIAQSLHAKASCTELFLTLLQHQIRDYIRMKQADAAFARPIVQDIMSHRRGTKEGIEKCVKAYASILIRYGHFERTDFVPTNSSSSVSLSFLRTQMRRLLDKVAKLTSYLAWLYGVDTHENTVALGYLITNIFQREMQENEIDPSEFLPEGLSLEDHWKSVKLRFILGLDKSIVPQLRPKLAGMLAVASEFNAIFEF